MQGLSWLVGGMTALLVFGLGCRSQDVHFVLRGPEETGLAFVNAIREDSLHNLMTFFYLYNGGGVAVGDINKDGLPDLYFSGNMVPGRLYLNRGNLHFEDITEKAGVVVEGWATGVTFVDVNGDGWLDLYVCRSGNYPPAQRANLLFINHGDLTFSEQAARYGLADTSYSTQAVFFDYDRDGDLDVYVLNHSMLDLQPNRIRPIDSTGRGIGNDRLYRNENGTFREVTREAGIRYPGMGLDVVVGDVNRDGWDDIYVANDFMASDYLYLNQGDGTFREVGKQVFKHFSYSAMGADLADVNNDGWPDLVVVEMLPPDHEQRQRMAFPLTTFAYYQAALSAGYRYQYWRNTLQRNNGLNAHGQLTFSEIGQLAGIDATDWSWAPLLADFDQDGYRDLWITNGYRRAVTDMDFIKDRMIPVVQQERRIGTDSVQRQLIVMVRELYDLARPDYVFRNRGNGTFENVSQRWGVKDHSFSNGAAYADLDGDGDLDVVVNRIDQPVALYENVGARGHYLQLDLYGQPPNTQGLGAKVAVYCDTLHWWHEHQVVRGYQSSVDYRMHFGLGDCTRIDSLRIEWPDGAVSRLVNVPVDTLLVVRQTEQKTPSPPAPPPLPQGLLTERGDRLPPFRHVEDEYSDFLRQPLLPRTFSQLGPGLAVGDVDGDGLEDFFVGGTYARAGWLFLQRPDGSFTAGPIDPTATLEDQGVLFFDADGDGDLDLLVAGGSGEFPEGSPYLLDRLYRNDGSGKLAWDPSALPDLRTSSSVVRAADFDRDGDLDLFIGGRLQPQRYPLPGRSYLLRSEQGRFVKVPHSVAPGLQEAGMVTDALWTDYNNDGWPDLIVVGEFMPIRVWRNNKGRLEEVTELLGLADTNGWWNSIAGGDFDQDGDIDYVLGNTGLNSRFRVSPEEPVRIYAADFDGNGLYDPLLTYYLQGREGLAIRMDELFSQVLLPRALHIQTYEAYARARVADLVYEAQLESAYVAEAYILESSWLENQGDRFVRHPLPLEAQVAPIFGLLVEDVDGDGALDVLAVGNDYASDVLTGSYDAFIGLWLRGDGRGHFYPVPHVTSGFFVGGDAKALVRLLINGRVAYLASENQGSLRLFQYRETDPLVCRPWPAAAAYALITNHNGRTWRQERYFGSGYLSQSSPTLCFSRTATRQVVLYNHSAQEVNHWTTELSGSPNHR